MQPLNLPLMRRLRVPPDARVKRARRLILKLLLPSVNLVGMDLLALRKVRDRGPLTQSLKRDLRRQPGSIRRLVFFVIVRSVYQTERPFSNLTPGPKNRVHFNRLRQFA